MKVQDYATRRLLESNYAKNRGDPMGIMAVNNGWGNHEHCDGDWSPDLGGHGGYAKGAIEHKTISNVRIQGSGRSGYRVWHDKFVNAPAQS